MLKMIRGLLRFVILVFSLVQAMAVMLVLTLRHGGQLTTRQRADQVQRSCQMMLRRLSILVEVHGAPPPHGLVVSNHMSFIDVLVYGAVVPCAFISKVEVLRWPIFGQAGALAGSVFIDRSRSAIGSRSIAQVQEILEDGVVVLLFPEGTSTDGSEILPFHPSFYEPAVVARVPVTAASIMYPAGEGYTERDLCYYGDISFFPRLLQVLGLRSVRARVDFSPDQVIYDHRKTAVRKTRDEVIAMRLQQQGSVAGVAPLPIDDTEVVARS
jgi:1-acyl-sn-glycerol-3-phosphate acyltransferase